MKQDVLESLSIEVITVKILLQINMAIFVYNTLKGLFFKSKKICTIFL